MRRECSGHDVMDMTIQREKKITGLETLLGILANLL